MVNHRGRNAPYSLMGLNETFLDGHGEFVLSRAPDLSLRQSRNAGGANAQHGYWWWFWY
jgi:hypothetical protein